MATIIQHRRGAYANFDPQKMKPGEWAVVQTGDPQAIDGEAVYMAFQAGIVKRMATIDELTDYNSQSQAILNNVTNIASQVATNASNASTKAAEAQQSAQDAATAATNAANTLSSVQSTVDTLKNQAIADITQAANTQKASAIEALQTQYNQDVLDFTDTYNRAKAVIEAKAEEIRTVVVDANRVATQALTKATDVENELTEQSSRVSQMLQLIRTLEVSTAQKVSDGYADSEGYLILVDENGDIINRIGPFASTGGGGGGGTVTTAELTATNTTGWISNTIAKGVSCEVKILWSSIENDMPTGNGTATIRVNNIIKGMFEIQQGEITINLSPYLDTGTNNVKVIISDTYGQQRPVTFNISVADLSISSTFDNSSAFDGVISFPYTPVGNVAKTVHFILDGNEIATKSTSVSGGQLTQTIPAQSHGAHSLRVYFEATLNNQTVRSNELYYEFISTEPLNNNTIIISSFNTTTVSQYELVTIPYRVYTPNSDTTDVSIYLNNALYSTQTVDRTEQAFSFRANTAGTATVRIEGRGTSKSFTLTVQESSIDVQPVTDDLVLYLDAEGRSNNEATRDVWEYGNISATLSGFTWRNDGWQTDSDGATVLRLSGDARVSIPYKIFERDFKVTGKTIEIEFATREVADYTANILSCFADNIGIKMTPQIITFKGAQTELTTPYKDNEHLRISITIEKQGDNRLILIYINGIMSRAIQYASGERFSQLNPVNISIGSNDCGIDIYNIRVYDNNLTRRQVLNNWIADTSVGSVMLDRYTHNNVYNENGNIVIANLPNNLPYMIIKATELPRYKGYKVQAEVTYTDPVYPSKSFEATNVEIDAQGTSSSVYYIKNIDMKYKSGFDTQSSGHIDNYALRAGSIPFNRFVLKADVASIEGINNTELVMFYNDTCPYKVPEMLVNDKVRWGIEGIPIVMFWYNTDTQETVFMGKYNFNLPKRAPAPYGYSGTDQSWEIERNNSENVKFQDDDFTTMAWDELEQKEYPAWYDDFEARFPSDEWRDYHALKEFISWIKSTNRETATNTLLDNEVVYRLNTTTTVNAYPNDDSYTVVDEMEGGVATGYKIITFTKDTPAYRLTKFRAEFADYAEIDSAVYYYLFTEFFLMIDSRAKNLFIGFHGSDIEDQNRYMTRKAVFEPYDMDTAMGTNNSGVLMFDYSLEDIDTVSGIISGSGGSDANVFNAQDSVLWCNVRDAYRAEITSMYRQLRSGMWTYNILTERFNAHQALWPEAVFNEDQYIKHLTPLIEPVTIDESTGQPIKTDRYLTMTQGSKASQRAWWLYNRFRYMDSKYSTGNASSNRITMRLFNGGTLRITPAINMYLGVYFGGGTTVSLKRAYANQYTDFVYTQSAQEMETWIDSGDLISDVGDLSVFYPNELDFSKATRLKRLQIGNSDNNYSNTHLTTIDVRNSVLLEYIDLRNCPNLAITVNLENSVHLQEAYFDNTAVTGVDFADGGALETIHLPGTITTLSLVNLTKLEEFVCPSFALVSRVILANIDQTIVNPVTLLQSIQANSQVNIQGLYLELANASAIESFLDLLDTMQGVTREKNASGEWIYHDFDTAQVSGEIHTESLTGEQIASYNARYPYLRITADSVESALTLMSYDNETVYRTITCRNGVPTETVPAPNAKPDSSDGHYSYTAVGWNLNPNAATADPDAITDVIANRTVYPVYTATVKTYTVTWKNGNTTLETDTNVPWGTVPHYDGATPTSGGQTSTGWLPDPTQPITGNTTFTAQYLPVYTVTFKNDTGSTTLDTQDVVQGQTATYGGTTPTSSEDPTLTFLGWATSANSHTANATLTNVQASMTVYAAFESAVEVVEITDSWDTIIANIDNGTYSTRYKIGNYKPLDLGTEGTINMQIVAMDTDVDANNNMIPLSFIGIELLENSRKMNNVLTTTGGWSASGMRSYLTDTILPLVPSNVAARITKAKKYSATYENDATVIDGQITYDKLWIPGYREIYSISTTYETQGPTYGSIYDVFANRNKHRTSVSSSVNWWLRSTCSNTDFFGVNNMGGTGHWSANVNRSIALGFCLGLEQETITDSWETILANPNYATDYSIGDTKELDLGTEGKHLMEIVAFDEDDRADGNGKAGITWISKDLLNTHVMNTTSTSTGGWETSIMRVYLENTIKPLIPTTVRNAIIPVTKVSSTLSQAQTTTDSVWIPSHREVFATTGYEISGAIYNSKFNSDTNRIKYRQGVASAWWLRSVSNSERFRYVTTIGSENGAFASSSRNIAIGFCTN